MILLCRNLYKNLSFPAFHGLCQDSQRCRVARGTSCFAILVKSVRYVRDLHRFASYSTALLHRSWSQSMSWDSLLGFMTRQIGLESRLQAALTLYIQLSWSWPWSQCPRPSTRPESHRLMHPTLQFRQSISGLWLCWKQQISRLAT